MKKKIKLLKIPLFLMSLLIFQNVMYIQAIFQEYPLYVYTIHTIPLIHRNLS